ncbi:MAG: hypothetical protein R2822_23030 [Spirosomataceae bacterium]
MGAVKPAFAMANRKIDNNMFQYQLMYDGEQDDVCQRCVNCGDGCDGRKSTLDLKALLNTYEISQR